MEMMMVKDEGYRGRRRFCMADGADVQAVRCVKRRRRDRASVALGRYDDNQGSHQEPNEQPNTSATTVKRSSKFRGVSRHRWTGRYEAHLWDKLSWNVTQQKKGKQVYLGAYYDEEDAARTYDLAALKYWGTSTSTNFPISDYEKEIEIMQTVTKEEYLASLRRKSNGFSRGVSKYRGVARHHQNGRWEARIGKVIGNKYLHLGTYSTQEEAARAYDIAAIEYRGINAVTNFDLSTYIRFSEPGTGNLVAANELLAMAADQPELLQLTTSYSPIDESKPSLYHSFHTDYFNSRRKQQVFESRSPVCVNSCNNKSSSSSPTALGLLLRSSIFRELVEKNANMSEDESINDEPKKQEAGRDDDGDEFSGVFYDVTDDFPLICLSGEDSSIELQAKRELPSFYDTYIYTHTHTPRKNKTP